MPNPGGSLVKWARNGVLLLNTCLTVEEGKPASHAGKGWEMLTDAIIAHVAQSPQPVVFMLWGAHAQAKQALIASNGGGSQRHSHHLVLTANHPSPLSALRPPKPFIGCGHFGLAKAFRGR
jgi:uracil-DNA glycosylase